MTIVWAEDARGHRAATVERDGHPQSYVDLDDPTVLAFEYVQHFASVLDALPPGPLAVTHVGGAGLTLARYLETTRPGSPQIVLEPDSALTELVRRELPLPRRHRIRVRPIDGLAGVAALREASADVVVVDAYADGRVPAELGTESFLADVARVLRPGGVALLNLADEPGLRYVARVAAGARTVLPEQALVATHEVLKGRRYGNTVLAASRAPLPETEIRRSVARSPFPTGVRSGAELRRWGASGRPFTTTDAQPSPRPPLAGVWRIR
ncbi:fused MFS/spermidine synthase [Arsenicicoccus piscis]|uniref:spermidine synthase n=1 Tax=Arsenicicoccus piscis TaxID=673954 RepID=UPI001F4C9489|nr:fused MFS/spermidine synthase [Arsenicicoccus piscis]MCH8626255.1 fused MFS/spermidine synthase [Arsenicicoccus piscis]